MKEIFSEHKGSLFFEELKLELPKLTCSNQECIDKNIETTDVYYLTNDSSGVNFKVNSNACCALFESVLYKAVETIYQKHK